MPVAEVPEHMKREKRKAVLVNLGFMATCATITGWIVAHLPIFARLNGQGLSRSTIEQFLSFPAIANLGNMGLHIHYMEKYAGLNILTIPMAYGAVLILGAFAMVLLRRANPYRNVYMLHGDADFARASDLTLMEGKKQISRTGRYLHFGYFRGKKISFQETLSAILFAPPGTGKTAGCISSSIIESQDTCMVIYDAKPELFDLTSGWRGKVSKVFKLEWASVDIPEKGIFYPKFNFLGKDVVPPPGPDRETFVDSLAKTLVPDPKDSSGNAEYFIQKGRAVLVGMIHYLICKINDDDDPSRWDLLPEKWHGLEASMPMMTDWFISEQQKASKAGGGKPSQDPMGKVFQQLVDEAEEKGYTQRCIQELQDIVHTAPQERSGIIGTSSKALLPFRNPAVAQRTSGSTFKPEDLRGIRNPETGAIENVSIYIVVNQADAPAFAGVTALFFEVCAKTLLAFKPNQETRWGTRLGPSACYFILDEFAKLPKMDTVIQIPDLGRSMRFGVFYCAQDMVQIQKNYSKEDCEIIQSTCSVKVILPQNNAETIEKIAKMVGKTTVKTWSTNQNVGEKFLTGGSRSHKEEGVNLLSQQNLATMDKDTQLLLCQGFMHRPIKVRVPLFFKNRKALKKVYNPQTGKGPKPMPPMPPEFNRQAMRDHEKSQGGNAWDLAHPLEDFGIEPELMGETPLKHP